MTSTTTHEAHHDTDAGARNAASSQGSESFAESLVGLGAAWARYGLRLGSVALENQSRHLEACGKALGEALASTAKTLATMADSMTPEKQEAVEARDGVRPEDARPVVQG